MDMGLLALIIAVAVIAICVLSVVISRTSKKSRAKREAEMDIMIEASRAASKQKKDVR